MVVIGYPVDVQKAPGGAHAEPDFNLMDEGYVGIFRLKDEDGDAPFELSERPRAKVHETVVVRGPKVKPA
jgi:hypothetical protein